MWYFVRLHIPEKFACSLFGFPLVFSDEAKPKIGQPVKRRVLIMFV